MTEGKIDVRRSRITDPAAWTREELGGKDGILVQLEERHLEGFDAMLRHSRGLSTQEVTLAHFRQSPQLTAFLADQRRELLDGRGAIVIRGVTRERYTEAEFEKIYWGCGLHWGTPVVQSMRGDKLGYVQVEKNNPTTRGSRGSTELFPHTDAYELVGLMSVRKADSGGLSRLVSGLAIHDEIMATRPDLMEALYRGYPQAVFEAQFSAHPVTPYPIPVFSCVDDQVSVLYSRSFVQAALTRYGVPMSDDVREALAYFELLADGPRFSLEFLLEPGEIMMWNNFTILHARSDFVDSPVHPRLLLRLWLDVQPGRPVAREIRAHCELYERLYREAAVSQAVAS